MADDIAQAIVRTQLVTDLENARVTGETERLRSALLSSVSHDLRSPLAAMIGAAGSLQHYGDCDGCRRIVATCWTPSIWRASGWIATSRTCST